MFRSSLLAAIGVVAVTGTLSAQPLPTTRPIAGTIVSADAEARTLVVKTGAATQTYAIAEDAKLEAGKTAVKVGDLAAAEGRRVTVWYTTDGDTRRASRVRLADGKGLAKASTPRSSEPATTPE